MWFFPLISIRNSSRCTDRDRAINSTFWSLYVPSKGHHYTGYESSRGTVGILVLSWEHHWHLPGVFDVDSLTQETLWWQHEGQYMDRFILVSFHSVVTEHSNWLLDLNLNDDTRTLTRKYYETNTFIIKDPVPIVIRVWNRTRVPSGYEPKMIKTQELDKGK